MDETPFSDIINLSARWCFCYFTSEGSARKDFFMLFTRDRNFYRTLFHLMIIVVFQNIIAYSINMADNLMLGMYSQSSLSGAATVNQIQFFTTTNDTCDRGYIGDHCFPILGTEKDETNSNIYRDCVGNRINPWTDCIYTDHIVSKRNFNAIYKKESYIIQGMDYLSLIRFTYPLFVLSTILMAALRSVETVSIALKISILSLIVDVSINYTLIFGKFGFPEMGTKGAAVGTLVARILELVIVVIYLIFADHKLKLFCKDFLHFTKEAFSRFFKILWPSFLSNTLWALATPIQTGILGRLSADAIAANSVSTTMFQYLKVITIGEASASAVLIGTTIGENRGTTKVKEYSKTLQVIYLIIGSVLGISLFFLRIPLLSLYDLTQKCISNGRPDSDHFYPS